MPLSIEIYSDLNPNYGVKKDRREVIFDFDSVLESIRTILGVRIGEMFFLRDFGSNLEDFIFDRIDDVTTQMLRDIIIVGIKRWEPRVRVDNSRTHITPIKEKNAYDIRLVVEVLGLAQAPQKTISFRLTRELAR